MCSLYLTYFTLPDIQTDVLHHMDILEHPPHMGHVQLTPKEEILLCNTANLKNTYTNHTAVEPHNTQKPWPAFALPTRTL